MSELLTSLVAGGISGTVVAFLLKTWVEARLKASIEHEYDTKLEALRFEMRAREQAAKVAKLMAEARDGSTELTPARAKHINKLAWERCGGGVLLIFNPRKSGAPGRDVPSHGTSGAGHIAFGAKPEDLDAWRQQLRTAGVSIEREVDWDEGGRSIYFRDPAGNVVELAPPTLWSGGWEF